MARNGSGTQTSPGASFPAVTGTIIDSSKFNNIVNDINLEITNSIANDGQTPITANLPMSGFKHTGAADATATGQYLVYGQSSASLSTPAQFDNDTSVATTAFVQRALGNNSGLTGYSANTTLTAANAGQLIVDATAVGPSTFTLPATSTMPSGAAISFQTMCPNGVIISRAGSNNIYAPTVVTSITMKQGDTLTLVSNGVDWFASNGSALLQYTASLGVTAAQFDNTTKLATTEFVQRALGNKAGQVTVTTTSTMSVSDVGKRFVMNSAGITVTLPSVSSVPIGSVYHVRAAQAATIASQPAETMKAASTDLTTFAMAAGEYATFISGQTTWNIEGGDTELQYSPRFSALLASNGYQKLPSGLIVQWATGTSTTTGDQDQTITFPIAFPTSCLHLMVSTKAGSSTLSDGWFQEKSVTTTNCVVVSQWNGAGNISGGLQPRILAIGY